MKYECKENDALIELGKDKSEVSISIQGDTSKIIIGVNDLKQALSLFGITDCGGVPYDSLSDSFKESLDI